VVDCSTACREEFAADPRRFASSQGPSRPAISDEPDGLKCHDETTSINREDQEESNIL
jgi:hypothetical protein